VVHGLLGPAGSEKDLNDSGDCNHDVKCSIGSEIDGLKDHLSRAAGILLVNGNSFCSSCLINNTAQDETPYVLTANHCMGANPSNIAVRFGWIAENPDCGTETPSENGPEFMVMSGTELLAANSNSDVALLRLNNPIPSDWDRVYAGWDRSGTTPELTFGIHHPSGDIMKVCRDNDPPVKAGNAGAETWEILESGGGWEIGVTEPGSSGSPLFDQEGHIVGQLFGGTAACNGTDDNDEYDYYGRFDVSWDAGADAQTRLKDWLDPIQSQDISLSAFPAFMVPDRDLSVNILINEIPPATSCLAVEEVDLRIELKNRGREAVDSTALIWSISDDEPDTIFYPAAIDSGTSVVFIDQRVSASEPFEVLAELVYLPGQTDSVPENDQNTMNYEPSTTASPLSPTGIFQLHILTDNYPTETSWEVVNEDGVTMASGGPYDQDQTLFEEEISITSDDCFSLNVFDLAADGLCCSFGEGGYFFISPEGDTLGQGSIFGALSTVQFQTRSISHDAALRISGQPAADQLCYDVERVEVQIEVENVADSTVRDLVVAWGLNGNLDDTVFVDEISVGDRELLIEQSVMAESVISAEIVSIQSDQRPENNQWSYTYQSTFTGNLLTGNAVAIDIFTDNKPGDIRWELQDIDGDILNSGGPYENAFTLHTEQFLLEEDACYQFVIFDAECNGIAGPGSFRLSNIDGETLITGRGFACSDTVFFHTEQTSQSTLQPTSAYQIVPNPAADQISVLPQRGIQRVIIYNSLGQPVVEEAQAVIEVSELPAGMYFVRIRRVDGPVVTLPFIKR